MRFGYKKQASGSFSDAVDTVTEALAQQGFGIITTIDVKATLKKKLGIDFENYIILGACNPSFAHEALLVEREIGLLLPCNVIVYENEGKIFVSSVLPTVAMGMVENDGLKKIAQEVEGRLKKAIDSIR